MASRRQHDTTSLEYIIEQFRHEGLDVWVEEATVMALTPGALAARPERPVAPRRTGGGAVQGNGQVCTAEATTGLPPTPDQPRHRARADHVRFGMGEFYDHDAPTVRAHRADFDLAPGPDDAGFCRGIGPSGRAGVVLRRHPEEVRVGSPVLTTAPATLPEVPWRVAAAPLAADLAPRTTPAEPALLDSIAPSSQLAPSCASGVMPAAAARSRPDSGVSRAAALGLSGIFLTLAVSLVAEPLVNPLVTVWSRLAELF